jgi:hypothetical protein
VALVAAFAVSAVATPAGISGAVLLLPFQVSVLGTPSPSVTPTNLLYNVVATPGPLCPPIERMAVERARSPRSPRSQAAFAFRALWTELSSADTAPQPSGTSRSR